jgi:hypothetical protein
MEQDEYKGSSSQHSVLQAFSTLSSLANIITGQGRGAPGCDDGDHDAAAAAAGDRAQQGGSGQFALACLRLWLYAAQPWIQGAQASVAVSLP